MSIVTRLHLLSGKSCCGFTASPETPDVISLDFIDKSARVGRGLTTCSTAAQRSYESEYRLTLYCAWRLSVEGSIVCGWRDVSLDELGTSAELTKLIGKQVQGVDANPITCDFRICFQGEAKLEAYCDVTNNYDFDQNYVLMDREWICTAGLKSSVLMQRNDVPR